MQTVQNILSNTFNRTNIAHQKNQTLLSDLFQDIETPHMKRYEVFETSEDVLTLSCAWYRLREEKKQNTTLSPSSGINYITDKLLFDSVIEEDRVLASNIRDYYSKKLMLLKLKQLNLTKYREDLNAFIHNNGKTFTHEVIGMVYRLPEFYQNDITLDSIFTDKPKITKSLETYVRETKTLTHIDTTFVQNKRRKIIEYWFTDESNYVNSVFLEHNNPLVNIWETIIRQPIRLNAVYNLKNVDDYLYYRAELYTIER